MCPEMAREAKDDCQTARRVQAGTNVTAFRIIGRGLSDTFEHLLPFTLLSLSWWLAVLLVIPGPAATIALCAMTDPRLAVNRPDWRDALRLTRTNLWRGWKIGLMTAVPILILGRNLAYFGAESGRWYWLAPLWLILLVLAVALALMAVSLAAIDPGAAWDVVKQAGRLVLAYPLRAALVTLTLWLFLVMGTLLVVPLVMFIPALLAATANRFVLRGFGIEIADPLEPTEERQREERERRGSSRVRP